MWIDILYYISFLAFFTLIFISVFKEIVSFDIPALIFPLFVIFYFIFVMTAPFQVHWVASVILAGIALIAGFSLFSLHILDAADSKILALMCLWAGPQFFTTFLIVSVLAGTVLLLHFLSKEGFRQAREGTGFARGIRFAVTSRAHVPYGVAISAGGVFVALSYGKIISLNM